MSKIQVSNGIIILEDGTGRIFAHDSSEKTHWYKPLINTRYNYTERVYEDIQIPGEVIPYLLGGEK